MSEENTPELASDGGLSSTALLAIDLSAYRTRCEVAMWGNIVIVFIAEPLWLSTVAALSAAFFWWEERKYGKLFRELRSLANAASEAQPPTK